MTCGGKAGLHLASPGWKASLEKEDLRPPLFKGASVSLCDMKCLTAKQSPQRILQINKSRNPTLLPSPTPASCDGEAVEMFISSQCPKLS